MATDESECKAIKPCGPPLPENVQPLVFAEFMGKTIVCTDHGPYVLSGGEWQKLYHVTDAGKA